MRWDRRVGQVALIAALALASSTSPSAQEGVSIGQDRVLMDTRVFDSLQLERLQGLLFGSRQPGDGVVVVDYDDLIRAYPDIILDPEMGREPLDRSILLPQARPLFQRGQFERAFDTEVAINAMQRLLSETIQICSRRAGAAAQSRCRTEGGVPELEAIIATLDDAPGCAEAVRAFNSLIDPDCLKGPCQTPSARRAYKELDGRCMASLTAWVDENGVRHNPTLPDALMPGADGKSALDAVAILQISGINGAGINGNWRPFCGGMLLSGSRVLTARHCFTELEARNALLDGRIRAVRTSDGETFGLGWTDEARKPEGDITDDVLLVPIRLRADQSAPAPPSIVLEAVARPAPAVALGYLHFRDFDRRLADAAATAPPVDWRAGLRFARPGLCHVIREQRGCVRTLCQTFPGYSGGPIFAQARDGSGRLVFYGLVSQAPQQDGSLSCAAAPLLAPDQNSDRVSTDAVFPAGLDLGA
jgi:hypothetical protein